jgi:hypothetical protein
MHDENGALKLPRAARRADSVTMLLFVAAVSGALLALADVMQEQRKQLSHTT